MAQIDTTGGSWTELLAAATPPDAPFLLVECQVDRGRGWSRPVRAYFARTTRRVVAIER